MMECESPWNVMKYEEKGENMKETHHYVIDEGTPYEYGMQPVGQTVRETGDGDNGCCVHTNTTRGCQRKYQQGLQSLMFLELTIGV